MKSSEYHRGFRHGPAISIALLLLLIGGWFLGEAASAPERERLWQKKDWGRLAPLSLPSRGKTGFTLLRSSRTGIEFANRLAEQRHLTNQILLNGSGVAAGDIDQDGWCDLYFCGLDGSNALYRNRGDWKFEEITAEAGVACEGLDATGAALADLNGDGSLDLIVNSVGGGTHVFHNDGSGRFTRVTPDKGLNPGRGGMSLALADVDGDGYLDVYVVNYRTRALMDMPGTRFWLEYRQGRQVVARVNGRPVTEPDLTNRFIVNSDGGIDELGEKDVLYHNRAGTNLVVMPFTKGRFMDAEGRPLAEPPFDWGLSAMFRDWDRDGRPDLYVCNDFDTPDRIWVNQGEGRFQAIPPLAVRKSSLFSMGIDFADVNRDGWDDFFVLDMLSRRHERRMNTQQDRTPPQPVIGRFSDRPQYSLNTFFLNRGDSTFAEIAQYSGLSASEWSWTPLFLDVDLDGWEDLLVSNGTERDGRNRDVAEKLNAMRSSGRYSNAQMFRARRLFPRLDTPNLAFRNRGNLVFEEAGEKWGFDVAGITHGMAAADLDNDGDLDLALNNLNSRAGIYRNETLAPRLAVQLAGRPPNTRGIGARIEVEGAGVFQSQEMICGGRYLSSDQPIRVFAAGSPTNTLTLRVNWPGGGTTTLPAVPANHRVEIVEPESGGKKSSTVSEKSADPLFLDMSDRIGHTHQEQAFADLDRQPLLPRSLSQLGPGVSWFDVDQDGWEDLLIASGQGGRLGAYRNLEGRRFKRWEQPPWNQPVTRDQTTLLGWQRAPDDVVVLAGSANYEDGLAFGGSVRQYEPAGGEVVEALPGQSSSTGPLAMVDLEGDGDLDLFVGGRSLPGKYPQPASSFIFRWDDGSWQKDPTNSDTLADIGMVSGAVFSDLDGDGDAELILACEWGPVRVWENDEGDLRERTEQWGLSWFRGWWNGVTTGDFNNDGRLDIVASNWGRNSPYEAHRLRPLRIYYGAWEGARSGAALEAWYDPERNAYVPVRDRDQVARALPETSARFATHQAYGEAAIGELLGENAAAVHVREATWLASTVFLNRGDSFEARPLPPTAQLAPAFGLCVGDIDGDGHEDLFLSQNFFANRPEVPRYDAGRGLWLLGDGHGEFEPMTARQSGVRVYGEQRGAALCDFDADGRLDLAVTQNGADTRLFRNQQGQPGLRVRLAGPPGNPHAVGAALRWDGPDQGRGPVRELHAGSGYWSQSGSTLIMTHRTDNAKLWIRWPDGVETRVEVPSDAAEIHVNLRGEISLTR